MFAIAIHGGAGTLPRAEMSSDAEGKYRAGLKEALDAGFELLQRGGSSLDAVTRAVVLLEDNPLFNAGKGAVFTLEGRNELDASIMDGSTLKAGAVAGVTRIRNPVELARAVMEKSEHVMLAGAGADYWPSMRAGTGRQGALLAQFLVARGEGAHADMAEACTFALRSVDGALVHRLLNDGPYADETFVLDSLTHMALAFLGVETETKPARNT